MSNFRDDIERLTKVWDKALSQGIFDDADAKAAKEAKSRGTNFFGQTPTVHDTDITRGDLDGWNDVLSTMHDGISNSGEMQVITEERTPSKKKIANHAKKLASSNNPVYPNTVGKDSKIKPATDFAGGKNLQKLIDMKDQLHNLKVDLTKGETLGKDVRKMRSAVENISREIDKISDMLNGSITDNK